MIAPALDPDYTDLPLFADELDLQAVAADRAPDRSAGPARAAEIARSLARLDQMIGVAHQA
jgi:hypothetical protein